MADYGIKVSQLDKSVYSDDRADILMSTKYTFAKIDPTASNTFPTVNFTFVTNPPINTIIKWYSIPYPYDDRPMVWQIWWDVTAPAAAFVQSQVQIGSYISNTAQASFFLYTRVNYSANTLDFYLWKNDNPIGSDPDMTGVTGTWSAYIFVDDLQVT